MAIHAQRFLSSRTRWIVFGLLLIVGIYLLAVTPVRTAIDQRSQLQAAEERYALISAANEKLRDRAARLQTDAEIERLARERYELVPEGKDAYAVMPSPPPPVPAPQVSDEKGLWAKIRDGATFWN